MIMNKQVKIVYEHAEIPLSLIFLCAVNTAMMYIICKSHAFLCTLIMTVITSAMYMMFYKLRKRKMLSFLAFMALFLSILIVNNLVSAAYGPVELLRFIFTTSNYFDPVLAGTSMWMFSLIFAYPTFYFTANLPRPGFLVYIAAIPIVLGARTTGGLPIPVLAFLVTAYILAAAGVARPEAENVTYFYDKRARRERFVVLAAFTAVALLVIMTVPINQNTPMGHYMDTLLLYRGNVRWGTQTISEFEERTQSNRGYNNPSSDAVFVAAADAPYKVIRESYNYYDAENGWSKSIENITGTRDWSDYINLNVPELIRKLKIGVRGGKIEKYKDDLSNVENLSGTQENTITIRFVDNSSGHVVLHPAKTFNVGFRNYRGMVYHGDNDEVWTEDDYGTNPTYSARFYMDYPNKDFVNMLENVNFMQLLNDAYSEEVISPDMYRAFKREYELAWSDFGQNGKNGVTPQIQALADEITKGLSNDYDKAKAIERYFENGFTYDLNYVPEESTAEYFLFTGKRGICTDFASAITLLLRAAGIPARYTEGYQLKEDSMDVYGQFIVKENQAHAWSTAYINGYGWLELDGTSYAAISGGNTALKNAMFIVLVTAAILGILIIVFRKQLGEAVFRISYRFRSRNGKIRAVYLRVRRLSSQISDTPVKSVTAEEVCDTITRSLDLGAQAAEITDAANELLYGNGNPAVDTNSLMDDYKLIYKTKRSRKK